MYIIDGIAYAGQAEPTVSVSSAQVVADYMLLIRFSSGEQRLFDAVDLLDAPAFEALKDSNTFAQFKIQNGTITWCDGKVDIAPEFLYDRSRAYESPAVA